MQKLQRELQLQSQWIEQRATELDEREARLTVEEQSLAERQQQWAEADLLLADSRRELTRLEQELGRERDSRAVELAARERQLDEEHRRREAVLARREQAVERQAEQLDHRRAALNESQQEVTALHREALEVRLATEELWAQLTRAVPAAMLSSTLADTRARLADHYRLASAELEARKAELQSLRTDLAEQHERLRRQTAEVEAWTAERLEELRRRELAMASRQSELDELRSQQHREYAGWREQRDRWEHQRRHFMIDQQAPGPRAPHLAGLAEARETADANI
jgi:chromosome segregation ATPase